MARYRGLIAAWVWARCAKSRKPAVSLTPPDRDILASVKEDETARRLVTIPGVGPLIAATVGAVVHDAHGFRTGRDFAAWTGLAPKPHSSGGKERVGAISKRGNRQLRMLLVVSAKSIIKVGKRGVKLPEWLAGLISRKPYKIVTVPLANKMARIIWARSLENRSIALMLPLNRRCPPYSFRASFSLSSLCKL